MQCVRSRPAAAAELHARRAGAEAGRPEAGERAGAGSQPPSPAGAGLRSWSGGMELSLGLLLFWALLPPEVPGKEGERGAGRARGRGGSGRGGRAARDPPEGPGAGPAPHAWGPPDTRGAPGTPQPARRELGKGAGCLGEEGGGGEGQEQTPSESRRLAGLSPGTFSPSPVKRKWLCMSSDPREFCLCLP